MRIAFFILILFSACTNDREYKKPKPENLIERKKFTQILEELMLIESHIQTEIPRTDLSFKSIDASSALIFEKYHVSSKNFNLSFDYYASDRLQMKQIYNSILERFNYKLNRLKPGFQ